MLDLNRVMVLLDARHSKNHVLAELEKRGLLTAVITQNIDGLHQASGLAEESIIELHGNTCRIRCMNCRKIAPIADVQQRLATGDMAPGCECGGSAEPACHRSSMTSAPSGFVG